MFPKIILIISTLFFAFTLSKFIQQQTENRWPFNPLIVMVHFYDPLPKNNLLIIKKFGFLMTDISKWMHKCEEEIRENCFEHEIPENNSLLQVLSLH